MEIRTNLSDGNFLFHAVPPQVTALLVTRPSITSDTDKETETSFRPFTSVSHSLLELNTTPVLRRSERIRNRIMMGGIQEEVSEIIPPFGRPFRTAEGPQLPRTDCRLSVPRKIGKSSETVTFSAVARWRDPGSKPKSPTFVMRPCNALRGQVQRGLIRPWPLHRSWQWSLGPLGGRKNNESSVIFPKFKVFAPPLSILAMGFRSHPVEEKRYS